MKVLLYTTLGCHLCEEALVLLHGFRKDEPDTDIQEVEISESDALMESYGIRIPVVRKENCNLELDWPFSPEELTGFLRPDNSPKGSKDG